MAREAGVGTRGGCGDAKRVWRREADVATRSDVATRGECGDARQHEGRGIHRGGGSGVGNVP